jgi:hypothetical protein
MKLFKVLLSVMFLATVMTVPTGCGKGKITEIQPTGEYVLPAGHDAKAKEQLMGKKPPDVK